MTGKLKNGMALVRFDTLYLTLLMSFFLLLSLLPNRFSFDCVFLCRPPGHHAMSTESNGYCFFNNAVLAAKHALKEHNVKRYKAFGDTLCVCLKFASSLNLFHLDLAQKRYCLYFIDLAIVLLMRKH